MRYSGLKEGEVAPDFTLPAVNEGDVSLSDRLKAGRNVLLVFLRHLGWLICREHVAQLCQHQDEFKKSNTEVIIISFGTPKQARAWLEDTCSPFTMVLDRERAVYRAYRVKKSWLRSWTPMSAWFYVRAILKGRKLKGIQGDPHQLGGDFIVDLKGIIHLSHPSRFATDRPRVSKLIAALQRINSGGS